MNHKRVQELRAASLSPFAQTMIVAQDFDGWLVYLKPQELRWLLDAWEEVWRVRDVLTGTENTQEKLDEIDGILRPEEEN